MIWEYWVRSTSSVGMVLYFGLICLGDNQVSGFLSDLAPGNDQIYEETQEKFLMAGNPQDGQVILYKVSIFL